MARFYYAKHYVRFGKRVYQPGEVMDAALDDKQIARLLRLKAIAAVETAEPEITTEESKTGETAEPEITTEESKTGETAEPEITTEESKTGETAEPEITTEESKTGETAEPEAQDPEAVSSDSFDHGEDAEEETTAPPEIDVMDGISAEPVQPKKTSRKKAGGAAK